MHKDDQYNFIHIFLRIFNRLSPKRKKQFWLILSGMVLVAGFETICAGAMAFFASFVANPGAVLNSSYVTRLQSLLHVEFLENFQGLLLFLSITVFALFAGKNIIRGIVIYLSNLYGSYIAGSIGEQLLNGFLALPYEWHLPKDSADLIQGLLWRYQCFIFLISTLTAMSDILIVAILVITVSVVEPLISLPVIIIVGGCAYFIFTRIRKGLDKVAQELKDCRIFINRQVHKSIHGIKDIKVYGRESLFTRNFHDLVYTEAWLQAIQPIYAQSPSWTMEIVGVFLVTLSVCIMYFFMGASSAKTTGTIALFAVTAWRVLPSIARIMKSLSQVRTMMPFVKTVLDYLAEIDSFGSNVKPSPKLTADFIFQKGISLENVFFLYNETKNYALTNLDFVIPKGSTTGIIGISGAGKSTLIDILIGLLEPTSGRVKIDGKILDASQKKAWMRKIGYVSQSPYICVGTLAENVAFGYQDKEIDRERVVACCKMAAMDDFLWVLPNGIDTAIGERGIKLSGGQRQRVAIARALYHSPEVMIFDEATSSLDSGSEKAIRRTIYSFKGKQTLIVIAHRLSSVEDCDEIIWLELGRVKKIGSPGKILPEYRQHMKQEKIAVVA
ncbi:MAG: ABC transporter ATP-binding protein [Dissulfuribacterales bacterium]